MNKKKKNYYETVIIFTPVLSDEQIKISYNDYKKFFLKKKIKILKIKELGMKKLAYEIKKKKNGFFYLFIYKSYPNLIKEINDKILQDERIIRFLIIKMNKYAIKYYKYNNKLNNEKKNKNI
ncbi:MAG: 30S ribosomal protein S6 [Candidatus Shikimatogenerans bostrichidophilus]|nr:MAG: 30S ribosomal protein S6 [Candidatus Shikimatogenerans bostrichidophilus]